MYLRPGNSLGAARHTHTQERAEFVVRQHEDAL
jgi:hypothetical protein